MDTTKFGGHKKAWEELPPSAPLPNGYGPGYLPVFFVLLRCFPITVSSGSCDLN